MHLSRREFFRQVGRDTARDLLGAAKQWGVFSSLLNAASERSSPEEAALALGRRMKHAPFRAKSALEAPASPPAGAPPSPLGNATTDADHIPEV